MPAAEVRTMTHSYRLSDAEIQRSIIHELRAEPRVKATEVGVEVGGGVVTLSGTVDAPAKKLAAVEAAHRVPGVRDVANEIRVIPALALTRTDADIARAVRDALERDREIPADHIHSTVADRVVALAGRVASYAERDRVEHLVVHLAGVRAVKNEISVLPPEVDVDDVLRVAAEALARRAEIVARGLEVSIEDGNLTVRGRLDSQAEKAAILGALAGVPGIRSLADGIEVV
jgi:osmotically-inducible protein OsmY